jgi:hypothetical protein
MSYSQLRVLALLVFALVLSPRVLMGQTTNANADKIQALQKQLDDMKAQMVSVQAQIAELSSGTKTRPAQTESASEGEENPAVQAAALHLTPTQQVGNATSTYQTDSQDQIAAPRVDNAPLDPKYPGYFRIPGTSTMLKIGGYFKTDFIYDLKPSGDGERFIPSTFPIPTPPGVNNTTVSIRPTRLNLDFLIPVSSASVRFFIEGDLFGSNATTPRLRHAYAQVKNLLLGQTFSNFQDPDAGPDTLDFQGPNSQVSIRNPQLRYTIKLSEKTNFRISVEKASSDVAFETPEFKALPNAPSPDGAVTFRHDNSSGHIQISALFRGISAFLPDGRSGSVFGWGFNASGAIKLFGKDTFVYQGAYGAGIERYVNDTSGLGADAAPADAARPHLKPVPLFATFGAYQHYWAKRVRSSLVYGFAQMENTDLQTGSTFHQSNYSAANIIWNPLGSLNVGAEFLYGWIVKKDNSSANAPRIMLSAKYNFVKSATH